MNIGTEDLRTSDEVRPWNYRIVRYRDGRGFGLHEVHYDRSGRPWGISDGPAAFVAFEREGPHEVVAALRIALVDAGAPVLDEVETWPGKEPDAADSAPYDAASLLTTSNGGLSR